MWITSSLDTVRIPTRVALGNFDGVHRGHRRVIEPILDSPAVVELGVKPNGYRNGALHGGSVDEAIAPGVQQPHSTVLTFRPHPQEFFTGQQRQLLTPLDEKVVCLRDMGVQQLVLLPFDQTLAEMSAQDFVEIILVQRLRVQEISVGQDFRFGCKRSGTTEDLKAIAAAYGVAVQIIPLHTSNGERISSSAIRQALQSGDLAQANHLLGRPYTLMGEVVHGQQLGRLLGFPTANLKLPTEKFLPHRGVYSVRVSGSALTPSGGSVAGVMNIGNRPTVDGVKQTIEVHLLDWSGDLYGQTLTVSLEKFIRPEQKFASLDALKAQIQADCEMARSLLAITPLP
ncbi:bifunctional riboflavin kinase/FAD synthetase [Oscillatoria sp. FACHB-1407]|uniref:bifunctional riboflavin kinase/FAD synthetase n=1 Tax=Oscillatoria sp. FACHB-1407 TaxID=2692847 RepID=UPI0016869A11|nr:bifunctional riboflavin kinase/FAD synthetase [Oscillatoria sp. FACHB-1407]MBD2464267.1 bifunctional riboflavin kinase/FAD synthetase [Oscillatoria sp. FACHB-1407]